MGYTRVVVVLFYGMSQGVTEVQQHSFACIELISLNNIPFYGDVLCYYIVKRVLVFAQSFRGIAFQLFKQ